MLPNHSFFFAGCGIVGEYVDVDVYGNDYRLNVDNKGISTPNPYIGCNPVERDIFDDKQELRGLLLRDGDYTCCCCALNFCYKSSYWEDVTVGKNIIVRTEVYHDPCMDFDDAAKYDRPGGSFA